MSSPSLDIPLEDLTQDRLHQWWALPTDRQRFVWALQTETRVRAHKVLQRDITPTLQSKLLFDIYLPAPDDLGQYDPRIPNAMFPCIVAKEPDAEFDTTAHRLDMKHPSPKYDDAPLAPPNMLFFDLLLEAYCGYSMQGHFHPADPSMPRAAIMGGAIVAVLVSWRDPKVAEMKEWEELEQWLQSPPDSHQDDLYEAIVERLQNQLQDYFYEGSSNYVARKPPMRLQFSPVCDYALRRKPYEQFYIARSDFVPGRFPGYYFKKSSAFVAGDVDIFLQPSPLTRSLACHLAEHGVEEDILKHVSEFIGGFEFCKGDLERMSTELCDEYIVPTFEDIGPLVYSATQRGLSFALSYESDDPFPNEWLQGKRWPRNTQLIMLSERADLLGGLFDFDISVAAFAYDGNNVRAAPRAVLSLLTNVLVVTPFVLAEKRNRQHIVKYYRRGFRPYMLDPFCGHERQCRHDCCDIVKPVVPLEAENDYFPRDMWHSNNFDPHNTRENPDDFFEIRQSVCGCSYHKQFLDNGWDGDFHYTFGVIAKTEDHLFDFLSKKNQWSLEHQTRVRSIHPMARKICNRCRDAYMLYSVLPAGPPGLGDSIDELLHGESFYAGRCFYSGGEFESTAVRCDARSADAYMNRLEAQAMVEQTKHFVRHGSYDGYKRRFTFGTELQVLLEEASQISFAEPHRRPLGLNPERFMAECEKCQIEMPGREYGTNICEDCEYRLRATQDAKPY